MFNREEALLREKSEREQLLEMKARWEGRGINIHAYQRGFVGSVDFEDGSYEDIWEKTLVKLDEVLKKRFK